VELEVTVVVTGEGQGGVSVVQHHVEPADLDEGLVAQESQQRQLRRGNRRRGELHLGQSGALHDEGGAVKVEPTYQLRAFVARQGIGTTNGRLNGHETSRRAP
jgi:hypothetical protein